MTTQEHIQAIHAALRLGATAMHLSTRRERGKARLKVTLFADGTKANGHKPPCVLGPVTLFARDDAQHWLRFVLVESTVVRNPLGKERLYVLRWTPAGKRWGVHTLDLQPPQPPPLPGPLQRATRVRTVHVEVLPYVFTALDIPQPR